MARRRSIICSIERDKGRLVGRMKRYANSWSRGAMSRGAGLVRLSGLMGHTKHKETSLFKLTCLMDACLVTGWVDLGAADVSA